LQNIGLRAGERRFEELMTREESESAFDLGDMYAVLPLSLSYAKKLLERYSEYKKVEIGSYNSSDKDVLSKDEVRLLLKTEGLV
ncbi:MAG: hypothetical protein K0R54_5470, partial [Clostridiaceae bacterium]|nr:hypothetical protein [Clostridiaceae bacterium]